MRSLLCLVAGLVAWGIGCGARTEGLGDGQGGGAGVPHVVTDPPSGAAGVAGVGGAAGAGGASPPTPVCIPGVSPGTGATQLLCMSAPSCPPMSDPSLFSSLGGSACKPGCIFEGPMTNTGPGACCYLVTLKCG